MPCMPRRPEQLKHLEQSSRHLRCRTRGLDGGVVLAPQQRPRSSAALEAAGMEDRAEAAAAAEDRRMVRAGRQALGALEELRHHLPAKAEPEPW